MELHRCIKVILSDPKMWITYRKILISCSYASGRVTSTCISRFSGFTYEQEVAEFTAFINHNGQARMSQVYRHSFGVK